MCDTLKLNKQTLSKQKCYFSGGETSCSHFMLNYPAMLQKLVVLGLSELPCVGRILKYGVF